LQWKAANPVDRGAFYKNLLRPALEAVGLPASRPATKDAPAVQGVRLHDLRHTFATLQLSAGVHFMQMSKWLGHSTFTLTLDVYGDYVPEEDGGALNNLPEPPAPAKQADLPSNVVSLFGRQSVGWIKFDELSVNAMLWAGGDTGPANPTRQHGFGGQHGATWTTSAAPEYFRPHHARQLPGAARERNHSKFRAKFASQRLKQVIDDQMMT
jgi:hypothetical protein